MKIVNVKYNGKKERVVIDDDIKTGELLDVIKKYVDTSKAISTHAVDVEIADYGIAISVVAIKTAPWKVGDATVFRDLPSSIGRVVMREVIKIYPLQDAILDLMWIVGGTELEDQKS